MESLLYEDKTFEKVVYVEKTIKGREFQSCIFKKCDFSSSDFSYNRFFDCRFESCNLSLMKWRGSALHNAVFTDCKIMGVNFRECEDFLFSVRFESCVLDYASFMDKKMAKTHFIKTSLKEVNFSQAMLAGSVYDQADLTGAIFNKTDLTGVDFTTAFNYALDPELNIIKKASFSIQGLPGLLSKYGIKIF